jgi:hypothetical protein
MVAVHFPKPHTNRWYIQGNTRTLTSCKGAAAYFKESAVACINDAHKMQHIYTPVLQHTDIANYFKHNIIN